MVAAAGGETELRFEVRHGGAVAERRVRGPVVMLGRRSTSAISFPDDIRVSRDHAEITIRGEMCVIVDRGTQNHTFVNGERLDAPRPLAVGDTIRLGADGPQLRLLAVQPAGVAAAGADAAAGDPSPHPVAPARGRLVGVNAAASRRPARAEPSAPAGSPAPSTTVINRLTARIEGLGRGTRTLLLALGLILAAAVAGGVVAGRTAWQHVRGEATRLLDRAGTEAEALRPADWAAMGERLRPALACISVDHGGGLGSIGSGFLIDPAGLVATNYHVIEGAKGVKVQFADGDAYYPSPGFLFASAALDLAVIKVELGPGPPRTTFNLATTEVRQLQPVAVFGSPQGLRHVLAHGTVQKVGMLSALRKELGGGLAQSEGDKQVIIHGAESAPGNSGGPLVDERGDVVGVHFAGVKPEVEVVSDSVGIVRTRRFAEAIAVRHLAENRPPAGAPVRPYATLETR